MRRGWISMVLVGALSLGLAACSAETTDSDGDGGGDTPAEPAETACETCAKGKAGDAIWCENCTKGYVDGAETACKDCVAKNGMCDACAAKDKDK